MQNNQQAPPNFDAEFCGNIPISHINQIQPHGTLMVINAASLIISQASTNTQEFLGITAEKLVGQSLADFLGEEQIINLQNKVRYWQTSRHIPLLICWHNAQGVTQFQGTLHLKDNYWILELEETDEQGTKPFTDFFQDISYGISRFKEAESKENLFQIASEFLKEMSGFDRIMIYKFDEDWHGKVVAEAMDGQFESYLGLHFPASDVPRPARELYARTPFRIISDAQAEGVGLFPIINPDNHSMLDLSESLLRYVPTVHREYLLNMQVRASMSTPVIIDNKLWGLISCHNKEPKRVNLGLRSGFEILSGVLSSQIATLEKEAAYKEGKMRHSQELHFVERMFGKENLFNSFQQLSDELMHMLQASGVILLLEDDYLTAGEVPEKSQIKLLLKWLVRYHKEKIVAFNSLPQVFPEAKKYRSIASGLMAIQLGDVRHYLLVFRPEKIKTVSWGGNPYEAVQFTDSAKKHYHPRNSFQQWKQQVEYTSDPWGPEEKDTAGILRTAMLEKLLKEVK